MRKTIDVIERVFRHAGLLVAPTWRTVQLDEEKHMRRLLKYLDIDCIFDVGANVGQYAEKARRNFEFNGRIISFEPNPVAFEQLKAKSANDHLWEAVPFALGSEPGLLNFQAYDDSKLGSFLEFDEASPNAPTNMGKKTIAVQVETLAAALPSLNEKYGFKRPFLKMDTQGFDLQVAKGAGDKLPTFLGIQSEVSFGTIYSKTPMFDEVVAYYQSQGFTISRLFPNNDVHFPRLVEMDVVMIRDDQANLGLSKLGSMDEH